MPRYVPHAYGPALHPEYPFQLLTPKSHDRIHSQGFTLSCAGNLKPHPLWIHPDDAGALNLAEGQTALVESPVGRIGVPVKFSRDVMPGVVCLIEGAWPKIDRQGIERNGSANILTSTSPTLPSQGSRTHSVAVRIRPEQPGAGHP